MAIVLMTDTPNMTATQYDAVMADLGAKLPEGCSARIAGAAPDGSWRVISVWEDMEKARAFVTGTLRPAQERAGIVPPAGPPVSWTLHALAV